MMFVNSKTLVSLGAALLCGAAAAVETITVDRVRQRTPWNGLVDVDYTVDGVTGDPNDYQIEFLVTTGAVTFVASNFTDAAWCDHQTTNGRWRATWNARADGITNATPVNVTARLVYIPITDASAEFAIVDLSSGSASTRYPVRYVAGDTNRTAQFNIDVYKLNKLVLKKVHAGEFWMGEGNVSSGSNRHRVRLTKDYFLGLFEVTRRQYQLVTGSTSAPDKWYAPGNTVMAPIGLVHYDLIMNGSGFMPTLNARAVSRGAALALFSFPTEAQWEYACRAGCEMTYYYGSDSADDLALYAYYGPGKSEKPGTTLHNAGELLPNDWGFYDMLGNAKEWCVDWYGSYPAYSETEVTVDPTGPDAGTDRVDRGGGFIQNAADNSSGARQYDTPDGSGSVHWGNNGVPWGFRLCLGLR